MADGCGSEWRLFFTDLEGLLCDYERNKSTNDVAVKESLSIRLESAVNALQSVSPYVSETNRSAIFEITRNFQLMFWDCQRGCEFRSRTRCSQIAVLSLSSPNQVHSGEVGRPRFDIREETLVELRSLGFSWEDVARMLLVSRWTVQRRVSEFGLPLKTENNWSPERIQVNGMVDIRNHQLIAVADMLEQESSLEDLYWYGYDPSGQTPMDDGLSSVEVEDVEIDLPVNVLNDLTAAINPLQVSNSYGMDLFMDCLNFLQSYE